MGRHRGAGLGGGNDEKEQTLNALLVEMDGAENKEDAGEVPQIILIAATNRPDVLDPALLRPGRFDRQIVVGDPDLGDREKVLDLVFKKHNALETVSPRHWATQTIGMSCADLANLGNEASIIAVKNGRSFIDIMFGRGSRRDYITDDDVELALDKIRMGSPKSLIMTAVEKRISAGHEIGHVLTMIYSNFDRYICFLKVTIIPRGRALGVAMARPLLDKVSQNYDEIGSSLTVVQGGREAELLMAKGDKGRLTTGLKTTSFKQRPSHKKLSPKAVWAISFIGISCLEHTISDHRTRFLV